MREFYVIVRLQTGGIRDYCDQVGTNDIHHCMWSTDKDFHRLSIPNISHYLHELTNIVFTYVKELSNFSFENEGDFPSQVDDQKNSISFY